MTLIAGKLMYNFTLLDTYFKEYVKYVTGYTTVSMRRIILTRADVLVTGLN